MSQATILYLALAMSVSACSSYDPGNPLAGEPHADPALAATREELATATVTDAGQGDPTAAHAALADPAVVASLRQLALQVSSAAGVPRPKTMQVVVGADRQVVEELLSGTRINDHGAVFVIKMTGGPFTSLRHPPGVPAPRGNVLTLTIDAVTRRVTDLGLVDAEPDLSRIGAGAIAL
ncbi:MAG: hypothetical protein JWN04_2405 [Myxococcaceae bacterium]|nr:hypothetical protein [Myxococcaceae bacterium]